MLNNLATILTAQGRYAEAVPLLERGIHIVRNAGPLANTQLPRVIVNLAEAKYWAGDAAAADPLCVEALDIIPRLFGPEHPDVAYVLRLHAEVLKKLGRKDEAKATRRRGEALAESAVPAATVDRFELSRKR
jgi:tetratricopeptide (TPR) repeat protein